MYILNSPFLFNLSLENDMASWARPAHIDITLDSLKRVNLVYILLSGLVIKSFSPRQTAHISGILNTGVRELRQCFPSSFLMLL